MKLLRTYWRLTILGLMAISLIGLHAVGSPHSSALSESVVIYQVQTGGAGSGTATQELVVLYNSAQADVEVTDWCIQYSSAADSSGFSSCLEAPDSQTELWLEAGGLVTFATTSFISQNSGFTSDVVMSGGLSASGGHLRLYNDLNIEIDRLGWGTASNPEGSGASTHASGELLSRTTTDTVVDTDNNAADFSSIPPLLQLQSGLYEQVIITDLCPNIPDTQGELPEGYLQDELGDCYIDLCPNLDELQITLPVGYLVDAAGDCVETPKESRVLLITELLPNAPSSDTGKEFIELYNPHNESIPLAGYVLQVGPAFTKQFVLRSGVIPAQSYVVLSDDETGIVLPNSSGVVVRLVSPAGSVVSLTDLYSAADDDVSWALVEDSWQFTNQITPVAANKPYVQPAEDEVLGVSSVLAPCPAGKYRNPATNRCRTIETAVSSLTPCDEDEYRNPDTNRCRKLASSTSTLTPCDAGEERNPETNRCRKVSIVAGSVDELAGITDVAVKQTSGSLNWPVIGLTVFAVVGYMLYEWRREITLKLRLLRLRLGGTSYK